MDHFRLLRNFNIRATRVDFLQPSDIAFLVIAFLTTPLLITCFSYFVIWKKARQSRGKVRSFRQNQEARFSRTIFIVTVASFITWMPFQLCRIVTSLSPSTFIPLSVVFFVILVQLSNSFVNFVIYFLRFPSYRRALLSMVHVSCTALRPETVATPLPPLSKPRSSWPIEFKSSTCLNCRSMSQQFCVQSILPDLAKEKFESQNYSHVKNFILARDTEGSLSNDDVTNH